MTSSSDTRPVPTTVTVSENVTARQYEQTASRDHDVTLIPGTYPLKAHYSPERYLTHYTAEIPAIAEDHVRSTVEFGGVALAWEQRGGETETYGLHVYSYALDRYEASGNYTFA